MSQSALPKLGVISTGAFFVVDLIGVILVSIVTAYILYRYFLKEVKLHDLFVSVIQSNYVHLLNLFIYKFISQFSNKKKQEEKSK